MKVFQTRSIRWLNIFSNRLKWKGASESGSKSILKSNYISKLFRLVKLCSNRTSKVWLKFAELSKCGLIWYKMQSHCASGSHSHFAFFSFRFDIQSIRKWFSKERIKRSIIYWLQFSWYCGIWYVCGLISSMRVSLRLHRKRKGEFKESKLCKEFRNMKEKLLINSLSLKWKKHIRFL